MTHRNSPLSVEGRRRLVERCKTRPIAHVAAEMGISRATASKWVHRHREFGEVGLLDRSSTPKQSPTATPNVVVREVERMRREHKWSAARITFELEQLRVELKAVGQLHPAHSPSTQESIETVVARRPGGWKTGTGR